jgi:hypothetical protein
VIIRALNRGDQPMRARLRLNFPGRPFSRVWQANLKEDLLEPLPIQEGGWVEAEVPAWGLWTTAWFSEG